MSDELQLDKPKSKKKGLIVFIIILVIAAVASYFGYHYYQVQQEKKAEKAYKTNLNALYILSMATGVKAEEAINDYQSVWHDAIFEDNYTTSDGNEHESWKGFEQAISDQSEIFSTDGTTDTLTKDMAKIEKIMNKLKNPPTKYNNLYKNAVDLYSTLSQFENMAEEPSGSLQSFTNDTNNTDHELSKKLDALKVQIPN